MMDAAHIPEYLLSSSEDSIKDVESFCKAQVSQINQSKRNSFHDHIQTHTLSTDVVAVQRLNAKHFWDEFPVLVPEPKHIDFPLWMSGMENISLALCMGMSIHDNFIGVRSWNWFPVIGATVEGEGGGVVFHIAHFII